MTRGCNTIRNIFTATNNRVWLVCTVYQYIACDTLSICLRKLQNTHVFRILLHEIETFLNSFYRHVLDKIVIFNHKLFWFINNKCVILLIVLWIYCQLLQENVWKYKHIIIKIVKFKWSYYPIIIILTYLWHLDCLNIYMPVNMWYCSALQKRV